VIPEGQPKNQDLIDAVITSSQKTIDVVQKDGSVTKEQILDDDTIYFKLGHVNSNNYGQAVYELKEMERTADDAKNNMCEERAERIRSELLGVGISVRRAFDAKGSETVGINKQNSQTNYIGMIGRNKQEKIYTVKDKGKGGSWVDRLLDRQSERDDEE